MIERYQNEAGKRLLVEALRTQTLIEGNEPLAMQVAEIAVLREYNAGVVLMEQEAEDNHIVMIITGSVSILVNGRQVNQRRPGQHVGEMALIDPKARRAASVLAMETTVTAEITEPDFSRIADSNPRLWRLLALELGERLRQRNDLVIPRNPVPVVFVGSSTESLPIAQEIQTALDHDPMIVRIWTDRVFGASNFPIEDLEQQVKEADFAVLILGPDDQVISRSEETDAPRDNVVFELGMFMGAFTRQRTFFLKPRNLDLKIPTDLLGLIPLEYVADDPKNLSSHLGPACSEIRTRVGKIGPR